MMRPIELLYCGNENVFKGLLISVLSVVMHTSSPVNVHILTMDLRDINDKNRPFNETQRRLIENTVQKYNAQSTVTIYDMSEEFRKHMGKSKNMDNFYTPYCMLRLFADFIPKVPEKLLYLDTDTVAMDDIQELYDIELAEYEYAGAIDYLGKIFKNVRYINSGVLLMNMKMIQETELFARCRELCTRKKMPFPDQDALNRLAQKKLRISSRYNSQRRLIKGTVIRHFCKSLRIFPYVHTINVKPWECDLVHEKLKVFYIDEVLDQYRETIRQEGECV